MGLLVAIIRRRELRKMQQAAEYDLTLITQAQRVASDSCRDLLQSTLDYSADSKVAKRLQVRKQELDDFEKVLKEKKEAIETQLKEIDAELKSCEQMIDSNIQNSFSYNIR
ncbi:MAG: hypothetical protein NC191_04915 [Muribaculaceae bacterium]|nr:hypothetical protein [Muribaculaceae bacterium]